MSKVKVITNFSKSRYSDSELSPATQHILYAFKDNPYFPNPKPTIEEVQTAHDDFVTALDKAEKGTKVDTLNKNNARWALEDYMNKLGTFVQLNCEDDEARVLSTGFEVSKKPAPIGQLPKPTNLAVSVGANRGSIEVSINSIKGARAYQYEYTRLPVTADSVWIDVINTKSFVLIDGLESGKEYTFRVAGIGSDPSRIWSEQINSFIL